RGLARQCPPSPLLCLIVVRLLGLPPDVRDDRDHRRHGMPRLVRLPVRPGPHDPPDAGHEPEVSTVDTSVPDRGAQVRRQFGVLRWLVDDSRSAASASASASSWWLLARWLRVGVYPLTVRCD